MSNQIPYTTLDRIFNKLERDFTTDLSEADVIEWAAEALEAIGAVKQYEEAVAFIEVKDHQIIFPAGFHAVIQIARNRCYTEENKAGLCAADVLPEAAPVTPTISNTNPNCPVVLDCNGMPMQEYDLAYYRPYFDLKWEYGDWSISRTFSSCFSPVNLANNVFFNSVVCKLKDDIYSPSGDEYTIIRGTAARFSFEKGQVAMAYLRQVLDPETGWPMIPDHYSFTTAIVNYIIFKKISKDFYANRQGSESRLGKAEADWQFYCKQAGNYALMLKGVDEHENFMRQRNYMIPQQNRYYGFFGKLSQPENRRFNDPDNRSGLNFFRGM